MYFSNNNGTASHAESLLVAVGCETVVYLEFFHTHASTPNFIELRLLAVVIVVKGTEVTHRDTKHTFAPAILGTKMCLKLRQVNHHDKAEISSWRQAPMNPVTPPRTGPHCWLASQEAFNQNRGHFSTLCLHYFPRRLPRYSRA